MTRNTVVVETLPGGSLREYLHVRELFFGCIIYSLIKQITELKR